MSQPTAKSQAIVSFARGVTIEDDVFIGDADWEVAPTIVKGGASIGSGAAILCGLTIGEGALVSAVVVSDVPAGADSGGKSSASFVGQIKVISNPS